MYRCGHRGGSEIHGVSMSTIEFPDTRSDRLIGQAMDELGEWVEGQVEKGISPIVLIGLIETYKAALANNLLVDEEDYD